MGKVLYWISILIVWLILTLLLSHLSKAEGAEIDLSIMQNIYQDEVIESSPGLKLKYSRDWWYLFASYEQPFIKFGGQEFTHIKLPGLGVGLQHSWGNLTLRSDIGYYKPFASPIQGLVNNSDGTAFWESAVIYTNQEVYPYARTYNRYTYEIHPGPGGSMSLTYTRDLSRHLSLGLTVGYRALKLKDTVYGWDEINGLPGHWEIPEERDFSAMQFGITFKWR